MCEFFIATACVCVAGENKEWLVELGPAPWYHQEPTAVPVVYFRAYVHRQQQMIHKWRLVRTLIRTMISL